MTYGLPPALAALIAADVTRLCVCWRVERTDGVVIRGTELDVDLTIATGPHAGTYFASTGITGSAIASTGDLSVDNLEVEGALPDADALTLVDLRAADLDAGLFDNAEAVTFVCDWSNPDAGQRVLRWGTLGDIGRTSEGRYRCELRGLIQGYTRNIVRIYSATCDAELGDVRCGANIAALILSGTVASVTSRRRFDASLTGGSSPATPQYVGGLVTWLTGDNAGFEMEVKRDAVGSVFGALELFEPMPAAVEVGDTFTLSPGCDKTRDTCRDRFANILNFRGHGYFVPGFHEVAKFGGQ